MRGWSFLERISYPPRVISFRHFSRLIRIRIRVRWKWNLCASSIPGTTSIPGTICWLTIVEFKNEPVTEVDSSELARGKS
jgi:hypothetical protein